MSTTIAASSPMTRVRAVTTGALVVITALALVASGLALWARASALDSDRFAELARRALERPEVVDPLAARLADDVVGLLEADGAVERLVPEELSPLVPVLLGGLRTLVEDQVASILGRDDVLDLLESLVAQAHSTALDLLRGDGLREGLDVASGTVPLDLLAVAGVVLGELQELGLIPSSVDLEVLREPDDRRQALAELSDALGVEIPESFGRIVVYDSESLAGAGTVLEQAQRSIALFERAVVGLVVATSVLAAFTLVASPDRRRTIAHLGVATVLAVVVVQLVIRRATADIVDLMADGDTREAVGALMTSTTAGAERLIVVLAIGAAVMGLVAFVAGPSSAATGLRRRLGSERSPLQAIANALSTHPDGARLALGGLLVAFALWWGLDLASLIVLVVLAGLGTAAIAIVGRRPSGRPSARTG